jgi:hypothetical protein
MLCIEQNDEWLVGRRYLSGESLSELDRTEQDTPASNQKRSASSKRPEPPTHFTDELDAALLHHIPGLDCGRQQHRNNKRTVRSVQPFRRGIRILRRLGFRAKWTDAGEVEGLAACTSRGGSSPLRRTGNAPHPWGFLVCSRRGSGPAPSSLANRRCHMRHGGHRTTGRRRMDLLIRMRRNTLAVRSSGAVRPDAGLHPRRRLPRVHRVGARRGHERTCKRNSLLRLGSTSWPTEPPMRLAEVSLTLGVS